MSKSSTYIEKHEKALKKIFNKKSSSNSSKSYKEKGLLETSAKEVVDLLLKHPDFENNTYLDVGCGTGKICFELIKHGAAKAIGTDLSDTNIEEAKQLARELELEDKIEFYAENFFNLNLDTEINGLILHMVLCCHPDLNSMLTKIIELNPNNVIITIPPGSFIPNTIFKPILTIAKIITGGFHAQTHSHKQIEDFFKVNDYKLVERFRNGIKSTFHFTKAE